MKYIIRVEATDRSVIKDPEKFAELEKGIECDGFVIMADKGDHCNITTYDLNSMDVAKMIAANNDIMAAATIAKAMRKAVKIMDRKAAAKAFEDIRSAAARKLAEMLDMGE